MTALDHDDRRGNLTPDGGARCPQTPHDIANPTKKTSNHEA
jgi:hypothetical protein